MLRPDQSQPTNPERNLLPAARTFLRLRHSPFLQGSVLVLFCLAFATCLRADTISGTVKDPTGAVVVSARIEIIGGNVSQPIVLATDESGKFAAPNLSPGKYSVRVRKEGFDEIVAAVDLHGTADLSLSLTIAAQQTSIKVSEKSMAFANSDAVYRQLREVGLSDTYRCERFTLAMDAGTFELKSGTITLLGLVNNTETGAVFIGRGHFTLKPFTHIDTQEMVRQRQPDCRGRLH